MLDSSVAMRRHPAVLHRLFDGEAVLYQPETDGVVTLDAIGSVIWQLLEMPGSVDELVPDLADVFGADPEQVRTDVASLFEKLGESDVIEPAE